VVTDPAIALLRDGSRIPLSDPLDEARRHWRDGEYDSDVIGIEAEPVSQPAPRPIDPQTFRQEALQL
jgi:hypothetical protein